MSNVLADYFRCGPLCADVRISSHLSEDPGYFTFGGAICYGRVSGFPAAAAGKAFPEVQSGVGRDAQGRLTLPFDVGEVVSNLQHERYEAWQQPWLARATTSSLVHRLYYAARPILPTAVRRRLQRIRLNGWESIAFPNWPVDTTVDTLLRRTLALSGRTRGVARIPFIWFWPEGAPGAVLMTHDVEGPAGDAFCGALMDLDERHGIKASFQLVPEVRSEDFRGLRAEILRRGFEVNLHDLNHDGCLFDSREQFLERAAKINHYAREFECRGFRAGAMYRQQAWFEAFEFSYDMSVPNAAHLEPQRGGCCSIMPYFVGNVLELPLTTVQDYSLFHILGDYSIRRWQQQCECILARHGLMSFVTHPDYLVEPRAQAVYVQLLRYLQQLRDQNKVWVATAGEVDRWWRNRRQMALIPDGSGWRIEGPDSGRARVAYAVVADDDVSYEFQPAADAMSPRVLCL